MARPFHSCEACRCSITSGHLAEPLVAGLARQQAIVTAFRFPSPLGSDAVSYFIPDHDQSPIHLL